MTPEEATELASLPERVTIYRGIWTVVREDGCMWGNGMTGLSWTLDRTVAHWFALQSCGDPNLGIVKCGTVRRERIIALQQARTESEIIVEPRYVYDRRREEADWDLAAERHTTALKQVRDSLKNARSVAA